MGVWLGAIGLASGLIVAVGWPAGCVALRTFVRGFQPESGAGPVDVGRLWGLAIESSRLVAFTECLVLPLGVLLAFLIFRTDLWGRRAALPLLLMGLFVPLPLHAVCWLGAFGNQGRQQALGNAPVLVGTWGAAVVHAVAMLPWVVLIVGVSLRTVEAELEEQALLEMPAWRVIWIITLRRCLGGIAAAAVVVAVLTAGEMTVTDLIPLRTYAEETYIQAQQGLSVESVILRAVLPQVVVVFALIIGLGAWLIRLEPERLGLMTVGRMTWRLNAWAWPVGLAVWIGIGLLVGLPAYGLIWRAGRVGPGLLSGAETPWSLSGFIGTMSAAWSDLTEPRLSSPGSPLWDSLLWAFLGGAIATLLAWSLAWAGRRSLSWQVVLLVTVALGLAAPAPVVGLAMKVAYVRFRWLTETPALLVLTYAARSLPFVLLMLWPLVRGMPQAWVDDVVLRGGGPARQFWEAGVLPGWPALMVACLLATALALGELPAAYFVYAPGSEPISITVWGLLHVGVESRLAGIGLWLLLICGCMGAAAACVAHYFLRQISIEPN